MILLCRVKLRDSSVTKKKNMVIHHVVEIPIRVHEYARRDRACFLCISFKALTVGERLKESF